jgi:GNAT superfamily N-acetyltransferase
MPDDVEIRIARDDELERVVRLRWLWTTERGGDAELDEQAFVIGAAAWARAHRDTHIAHIAVDPDGGIVGMAWLALTPRVASTHSLERWSGDLQSCYVLPGRRDAGIGGRLVEAVLATARERSVEHVTVHTSADSIRMYARNGFRPNERLLWADSALTER